MEINELITYVGFITIFISVIIPTAIQLQKAKKTGVINSQFTKLNTKEKQKLKIALLIFAIGLVLLALGNN